MDAHRSDLTRAYDAHADDREERGEPSWRDEIRVQFSEQLPAGGKVLEIGAGVGFTAKWFSDAGFDVMATDLSPAHVEKIRAKGVAAEVRDMADLGFEPDSFHGVWAASCLMHIPDAELPDVLGGIRRVIRPGGWFWSGTWGGIEREGIWEDDTLEPKRFYSLRSHDRIQEFYARHFEIVSFAAFDPEEHIEWSYQSTLMRPRD